jgi:HPt (histidine-containing phosphotransfer) domain-containing protein
MSMTIHERPNYAAEPAGASRESSRTLDVPIDWAHLARFTLRDRSLEREVLGLFALEAPRYLTMLIATNSRKSWIEAAHTLKGSARAVGAWAVAEYAQAVETLELTVHGEFAEKRASRSMEQALDKLVDAVRRTLAYIDQIEAEGLEAHGA